MKYKDLIKKFNPDLIALEGPSIGSNNLQFAIGALHGVYMLLALNIKMPFIIVPPTKWKFLVIGTGKASKTDIKNKIKEIYPLSKVKQDVFDALAINIFSQRVI